MANISIGVILPRVRETEWYILDKGSSFKAFQYFTSDVWSGYFYIMLNVYLSRKPIRQYIYFERNGSKEKKICATFIVKCVSDF